jgi:hypothetical protein
MTNVSVWRKGLWHYQRDRRADGFRLPPRHWHEHVLHIQIKATGGSAVREMMIFSSRRLRPFLMIV